MPDRDWRRVLDGRQKPKGWIRTPEAHQVMQARAEDFVGMAARHAKAQLQKEKRTT